MMNLLLPTDFSENAQFAADFVFRFFDQGRIRVHLINSVVPPRSTPGMMINISDIIMSDAERDLQLEKERLQEKFGTQTEIIAKAKLGYLQDVVPIFCTSFGIDVIVMGTLGESNLSSKILGSNTEHIIRRGFAPVLAIPSEFELSETPRICVATSKDEIPSAQELGDILDSVKDKTKVRMSVLKVLLDDDKAPKSMALNGLQVRVDVAIAETPEDGIRSHLENNDVDVLVMCHRHNSRLDYLFSRSTTKKLTGQIQVPMMIMPEEDIS